jgi:predicted DNA-binding transcriptional regulator
MKIKVGRLNKGQKTRKKIKRIEVKRIEKEVKRIEKDFEDKKG